ncbi:MAG: hypothetical protein IK032_06020 [Bacteroidales bacterium]|nr:hypothetical protein [Bacteroidales bacterium]
MAGIVLADFALAIGLFAAVSALMCIVMLIWYYAQVRRYEKAIRVEE